MAAVDSLSTQAHTNKERYEPKTLPTLKPSGDRVIERKFYSFKNLQFESVRRETFKNWPCKFIDADDLARNGFFYRGVDDFVQCHFCRGVVGYWEKGDEPRVEHEKHYPNCPFVQGSAITNIPLDDKPEHKMLDKFIMEKREEMDPPMRKKLYQADSAVIIMSEKDDQYPDYSTKEKRLASFPDTKLNIPNPTRMAEVGFFLIGLGDMAHCYACGGGIFNWKVNEDPQVVHDTLYPNCRLAKERRGEKCLEDSDNDWVMVVSSNKRKISSNERSLLLQLPIAKKMMRGGWPQDMVSGTLAYELNKYGTLPVDINEASDAIMDYQEMLEAEEDDGFL